MANPLMIMQAGATAFQVAGTIRAGKIARAVGRMRNQSAQQNALAIVASGQRRAFEEQRQTDLMASRALTVAAAGGGNPDDPSISKIIADIDGEGAYRAAVAMYEAESLADKTKYEGELAEFSGKQEYENSKFQAVGQLMSGGGKMMGAKYG